VRRIGRLASPVLSCREGDLSGVALCGDVVVVCLIDFGLIVAEGMCCYAGVALLWIERCCCSSGYTCTTPFVGWCHMVVCLWLVGVGGGCVTGLIICLRCLARILVGRCYKRSMF
jgi:hypothetical protein